MPEEREARSPPKQLGVPEKYIPKAPGYVPKRTQAEIEREARIWEQGLAPPTIAPTPPSRAPEPLTATREIPTGPEREPRGVGYQEFYKYYQTREFASQEAYEKYLTQQREEWLAGLRTGYPELTSRELGTIGANIRYIQTQVPFVKQEARFEEFFKPWETIIGFRRYQAEHVGVPKPAWEAFYESGAGKVPVVGWVATGMFRGFDPVGKWIAEKVKGREIKVRPPTIKLPSYVEPFAVAGEFAGWYGLGAGVGRVAGFATPIFGKAFGGAVKTITISPLAKLAPRISPVVASRWAGYGVKVAGLGATVARHPTAIKAVVFGTYGAFEAHKIYGMYRAEVPPHEIFREVGKDVALLWGFTRGFPKGMEAWGKTRTYFETRGGVRIPPETLIEPSVRHGEMRFPTAPRGTTPRQLIFEFRAGRYTARGLLETLPPEYEHLLKRVYTWHTAAHPFEAISKVARGTSEQAGLYVAPSVSPHFLRIPSAYAPPRITLFGWGLPPRPTALHIAVTDILGAAARVKPGAAYISRAFAAGLKFEKEAILFPGTLLEQLPAKKAYSIWAGQRFAIKVFAAGGVGKPEALLEPLAKISSRYAGTSALITPREILPSVYYLTSYARPSVSYRPPSYKPLYPVRLPSRISIPSYKPPSKISSLIPSYKPSGYRPPSIPSIISPPPPPPYYPPTYLPSPPPPSAIFQTFEEMKKRPFGKVQFFDIGKLYRERAFDVRSIVDAVFKGLR